MNGTGPLDFESSIKTQAFTGGISEMERRILGLSKTVQKESTVIDQTFARLGQIAGGYLAFTELAQLPGKIADVRGQFQQLEISLNTMLGSKQRADKLMAEIVNTAASTPFGLKDLAAGTKQLLAYGSSSESVMQEIRMLGDVASGVSVPISELIYLYGTLRSQGRAYSVDIRQFAGRGIPIYAELAKVLGVNVDKVNEFVESGKVGFKQVEQAFKNMTSTGSMFGGLMEKQSQSILGLKERFSDALDVMFNDLGKSQEGLIASTIVGATEVVENYKNILDILTIVTAGYGAYKAAVLVVNATRAIEATSALSLSAAVDRQSGSYARSIALQVKVAEASHNRATALAEEAFAQSAAAAANVQALRIEVSELAIKKANAIESAKAAAAEIAAAEARLEAALANQVATSRYLDASVRNAAQKEVELAQNALLIASENGVAARKTASAASAEFLGKKTALETAAKEANTLVTVTNATATKASATAANLSAVANTRLTAVQGLQIAVTRQLAAAQAAWNASLLSNPIVLATVAIVGLAAAIWSLEDATTAQQRAQEDINKSEQDAKQQRQELTSQTSELTSVINSNTSTQFAQLNAYQKLQALYPDLLKNMTLQQFKTLDATEAQKKLNAAMDSIDMSNAVKDYEDQQKNIENLTKKLQDLQNQQRAGGPGASGLVVPIENVKNQLEEARIKAEQYGETVKRLTQIEWEANTPDEEKVRHYKELLSSLQSQKASVESNISSLRVMGGVAQGLKPYFENLTLFGLNQQIDEFNRKVKDLTEKDKIDLKDGGNFAHWEKVKKEAEDAQKALGQGKAGTSEWEDLTKKIRQADAALETYNTKAKKVAERDKPQPFGSVAYYDQIIRKIDEAISKLNPNKTDQLAKLQQQKLDAQLNSAQAKLDITPYGTIEYWQQVQVIANQILEKQPGLKPAQINEQKAAILEADQSIEAIRKNIAVKSAEEEFEEKKKQYELYEKWVEQYGKEVADRQFADLIARNKDYVSYLDDEIKKLRSISDFTPLTDKDSSRLIGFQTELNDATGKESTMVKFKRELDDAKESAGSLTQYLDYLKTKQDELAGAGNSKNATEQRVEVAEQIRTTTKERTAALKEFNLAVIASETKRKEIEDKFQSLRLTAESVYNDKTSKDYIDTINDINKKEQEEYNAEQERLALKSKEYKSLEKVIRDSTQEQTKTRVKAAKDELAMILEASGSESDAYQEKLRELRGYEEDHRQKTIRNWGLIADAVGQVSSILEGQGGAIGEIGSALAGLSSAYGNLSQAMTTNSDGSVSMGQYAAAVQGVITIIGTLISANKKRHEQEEAFALARLGFEEDYQLALNKQLGDSYKATGNMYLNDIQAKIDAGVQKYDDAQKKYQEAIDKLDEGRAKVRQKNAVDGKSVGQLAGAGAALGAVIGGIAGVGVFSPVTAAIGAVVGGAVGAIAGLFAKKKKDVFGGLTEQYPELIKEGADGWKAIDVEMAKALITNGQVDDKTKQMLESAIAYSEELEKAKTQVQDGIKEMTGEIGDQLKDALVNAFRSGEDAATAFGDTVGKIIAKMVSDLLFVKLMKPALDKLVEEATESLTVGDGTIVDDLDRYNEYGSAGAIAYSKALEEMNKFLEDKGYNNPFDKATETKDKTPLTGIQASVTEDTASILAGQGNALRISTVQIEINTRNQLFVLSGIKSDTAYLPDISTTLKSVDRRLSNLENADPLRSKGL